MPVIAWKKVYETGIVAFDKEHRTLVDTINNLYEAVRDKRGEEVLGDILAMVETYTVDHFQHEEKVMSEYGFSGLDEHIVAHQNLIEAVNEIKSRSAASTEALAQELLKFLRVWVLEHIVEMDKKYGSFLESRAGRFVE